MATAVIVDAVRTAVGRRNGKLKDWHPVDLASEALKALVDRTGIDPGIVEDVVMGCVMQVGEHGLNVGRNAWLAAGFPEEVPGTTVDRQCGSSQQAAHFVAQGVMAGAYDLVYLDGDHTYTAVRADIGNARPLVSDGGILCGDDLELQADEAQADIARSEPSLDYIYSQRWQRAYHPGVSLAVGEAFGRVSAWGGFWAMQNRGGAWSPISMRGMPLSLPPYASAEDLLHLKAQIAELGEIT